MGPPEKSYESSKANYIVLEYLKNLIINCILKLFTKLTLKLLFILLVYIDRLHKDSCGPEVDWVAEGNQGPS